MASPLDQNSITGCGLFPAAAEDNTRLYQNFTTKFEILKDELLVIAKYTQEYTKQVPYTYNIGDFQVCRPTDAE